MKTLCLNPSERWNAKDILYYYFVQNKDPYQSINISKYDNVTENSKMISSDFNTFKSIESLRNKAEEVKKNNYEKYYNDILLKEIEQLNNEYNEMIKSTDISKDCKIVDSIDTLFSQMKTETNHKIISKYIGEIRQISFLIFLSYLI